MSNPSPSPPNPPPETGWLSWLTAVKGLTITNVIVIAGLAVVAAPLYVLWKALGDEALLDRFLSTYEEIGNQQSGCTVRHAQMRGGPGQWGVSTGFAFQGEARWFVNVILNHEPDREEIVSYCEALKVIADSMHETEEETK